jgi:AraC-like DNA-binding protein
MEMQQAGLGAIRFASDDLPESDRIPVWRDFIGRRMLVMEIEPAPSTRFCADMTLRSLPGLAMGSAVFSPLSLRRTPALVADGNDDVWLVVPSSGCAASQHGRDVEVAPGHGVVMSAAEASALTTLSPAQYRCFHMSRDTVVPLVPNIDDATLQTIPPGNEALEYLLSYVRFLEAGLPLASPDLAHGIAVHLRDLFALAIGTGRDAAFLAAGRGLRAARLQAIKTYVARNATQRSLTVGSVATRYGVTPRYVQRLFETEGTTFSEFLLNQRLTEAHRILTDPLHARCAISAVAFEVGFGDLSYFNRCFRRRFGATPKEIRET